MKTFYLSTTTKQEIITYIENITDNDTVINIANKNTRSVQANRFFHGALLDAFVECTGDADKDYLKFVLKEKYLKHFRDNGGYIIKETHTLTVEEMRIFIDSCLNLLKEIGGYLKEDQYTEYLASQK